MTLSEVFFDKTDIAANLSGDNIARLALLLYFSNKPIDFVEFFYGHTFS